MPAVVDHPHGRVILLNGPPSSGKTTLARALQRALAEPWFHLSLDDFSVGYLDEHWRSDARALFGRLMAGYLASLRAMALAGNGVIAEAVITPERRALYAETFRDLYVTLIGVRCPLDVAVEREQQRTDRRHGPLELSDEAFVAVHAGLSYDLEVDTAAEPAAAIADAVRSHVQQVTPTAFARLAEGAGRKN